MTALPALGGANLRGACLWISINNLWLHLPSAIELSDGTGKKRVRPDSRRLVGSVALFKVLSRRQRS